MKIEVVNNYRRDLQETWILENDEIARHEKYKMYQGKLIELQIAKWLEENDWKIDNLKALGGDADIQCHNSLEMKISIEVKYIGQRDEEFQHFSAGWSPLHLSCNFILFRVYEAAKQLQNQKINRTAIIVVDHMAITYLDFQYTIGLINWESPTFYDLGKEWTDFINSDENRKKISKTI